MEKPFLSALRPVTLRDTADGLFIENPDNLPLDYRDYVTDIDGINPSVVFTDEDGYTYIQRGNHRHV